MGDSGEVRTWRVTTLCTRVVFVLGRIYCIVLHGAHVRMLRFVDAYDADDGGLIVDR